MKFTTIAGYRYHLEKTCMTIVLFFQLKGRFLSKPVRHTKEIRIFGKKFIDSLLMLINELLGGIDPTVVDGPQTE